MSSFHSYINAPTHLNHLLNFYDEIKIKSDQHIRLPFSVVESYDYKQTIHLQTKEDTLNLLQMTPHYYHIKKERRHVLDTLGEFDVTIDIRITVYQVS